VLTIQTVHTADSLKQPMIAHLLVDVEIASRWRVKAGQELVHHDQKLHLPWLLDELLLGFFLKRFGVFAIEHLVVYVELPLCQSFTSFFTFDIGSSRFVRGDDGALIKSLRGK